MPGGIVIPIGGLNNAQIRIHHHHDTVQSIKPLLVQISNPSLLLTSEEVMDSSVPVILSAMSHDVSHLVRSDIPLITTPLSVKREVLLPKGIAVRGWPPSTEFPVAYSFSYPCEADLTSTQACSKLSRRSIIELGMDRNPFAESRPALSTRMYY